ncbi:O-antigen ligase family protein [Candidatus Thioglobus sp.]|nr:O-antigen ligase family protein [Candidatus Thioglobus sp.]
MQKTNNSLNTLWVGIFLFLLAIASPWFNLTVSNHEFIKSYFAAFGIALLMMASLFYKSQDSEANLKVNYIKLSLFSLFLFGTASFFWTIDFDFTFNKWLLWLTAAFSFILAINLSLSHDSLIKLTWGLLISAGTIAIIGILQYLFDPFTLTQSAIPGSTFANKNIASQVLVLILPLSYFLILSKKVSNIKVWLLTAMTAFIFVFIFYATSRAAWIVTFIEILLIILYLCIYRREVSKWCLWNSNKRNASIFGLLLILILVNVSSTGFTNFMSITADNINSISESASDSSSPRYQIWKVAFNIFSDSPIVGSGLGSFSQNLGNEGYATWTINNTFKAHNDLLELSGELGLIGVFIFILVIISIIYSMIIILKNNTGEIHFFYFLIFVALVGSFINLQFSFPYQMPVPILLFGLYLGLISQQVDAHIRPIKTVSFLISKNYKKIFLSLLGASILSLFFISYVNWIHSYNQLNKMNGLRHFDQIEDIETPIHHSGMQSILYSLGGSYFNKGSFVQSKAIDKQFLKIWPNHLDVLFRIAYAEYSLGNNSNALKFSEKLKKLEPQGLYNGYIVEMFVYSSTNKLSKLEQSFNELLSKPERFLRLNDDTYRFLIFFTLSSNNLSKHAPLLYKKYIENHGYTCEVENNLAIHYFNLDDFVSSVKHVERTFGKDQKCLNPELITLLKEQNLIE